MFQILWSLLAGLVIGLIAKVLLPGRQYIPIWLTVVVGIAGAFVGNGIASWIGVRHASGVDWLRHILQIGFATVLIALVTPVLDRGRARGAARSRTGGMK